MKIRADMCKKSGPLWPLEYTVDRVANIPADLFDRFMSQPQGRYSHFDFIEQNHVAPYQDDGVCHCLLVLCEGRVDGVLVQCDGYGGADLSSYLPGARDVVQAGLDRAAGFIVRQGAERTVSGSWFVYCEELEEKFGLSISEGNGLDAMLRDTLERRPEVEAVRMGSGTIETTFRPEFCKGLKSSAEEEKPDIRVRDILPLLTGGGLAFLTHEDARTSVLTQFLQELTPTGQEDFTALLDARVAEIGLSCEGVEIVLADVEPEELERFNEAYDAFQDAEQAMGDMTP